MRVFDRLFGVALVLLAGLTIGSMIDSERQRDADLRAEREAFADQRDALQDQADAMAADRRAAQARALAAEREATRLRRTLIALALAEAQDDREAALALLDDVGPGAAPPPQPAASRPTARSTPTARPTPTPTPTPTKARRPGRPSEPPRRPAQPGRPDDPGRPPTDLLGLLLPHLPPPPV